MKLSCRCRATGESSSRILQANRFRNVFSRLASCVCRHPKKATQPESRVGKVVVVGKPPICALTGEQGILVWSVYRSFCGLVGSQSVGQSSEIHYQVGNLFDRVARFVVRYGSLYCGRVDVNSVQP